MDEATQVRMMESVTGTPHDAVFKKFLMHVDTARDFLDIHLPAELRKICDLDTLQLASGSFVEEDLKAQYSDVLYSLNMQGAPDYLHILIEHQSSPDKKMAFRMIRYAIAAMHRHIEAGYEQLPLVIPFCFIREKPVLTRIHYAGWICLPPRRWRSVSIVSRFRWWILP